MRNEGRNVNLTSLELTTTPHMNYKIDKLPNANKHCKIHLFTDKKKM